MEWMRLSEEGGREGKRRYAPLIGAKKKCVSRVHSQAEADTQQAPAGELLPVRHNSPV